jgi:hypothetical protein
MGILERHSAFSSFADVSDDVGRMYREAPHQFGDGRIDRGFGIHEDAAAGTFKERDSPPVRVMVGRSSAAMKSFKGKADVGRNVTVHSK